MKDTNSLNIVAPTQPALMLARELGPLLERLAPFAEKQRKLSEEVPDVLHKAGLFNLWVPESLGGPDLDPVSTLAVLEELAVYDASSAWIAMIGIEANGLIATRAPDDALTAFFAPGERAMSGGVIMPGGAVTDDGRGNFVVTGRWSFGSGCQHASWMVASAMVLEGGGPKFGDDGMPDLVNVMIPRAAIEIEDDWNVLGLRGTGSCHFKVTGKSVPISHAWPVAAPPRRRSRASSVPELALLAATKACIALGVGRGAVKEFKRWAAASSKPMLGSAAKVSEDPCLRSAFGRQVAALEAARAFLFDAIGKLETAPRHEGNVDDEQIAFAHLAAVHASTTAHSVVTELCYVAGTSAVVYDDRPLQRMLRDVTTIRSHISASNKVAEASGAALLGSDPVAVLPFWQLNRCRSDS